MKPDALSELRDIHLPEPVSWWPLAPGWWLLIALCCLLALAGVYAWRRYSTRRHHPTRNIVVAAALAELDELQGAILAGDSMALERVSSLMRRMAVKLDEKTAGLTGSQWLRWLDSRWARSDFVAGPGQALTAAPYQAQSEVDAVQLGRICRQWLEAQR